MKVITGRPGGDDETHYSPEFGGGVKGSSPQGVDVEQCTDSQPFPRDLSTNH
jgi:hypothetical protein